MATGNGKDRASIPGPDPRPMNLPKLFATANINWTGGEPATGSIGRMQLDDARGWLKLAIREIHGGAPTDTWILHMAGTCCCALAELDAHTRPDEMVEHLQDTLHDAWVYHHEYSAWIANSPAESFGRIDEIRKKFGNLETAQAAEIAMQEQAHRIGTLLIAAAEREWTSGVCRVCEEYPFPDSNGCRACSGRESLDNGSR
ncbi:MAG: hypothetical protein ACI8Y8_001170 [Planctomycetota bacterium]